MKAAFNTKQWGKFGNFYQGSLPVPYILPKYKDAVAKCDEVFAKKGV